MKRFLSWLVLIVSYLIFAWIVFFDILLTNYIFELYDTLSSFLKLIVLFFGGSFILGVITLPLFYGIPAIVALSDLLYESKKGLRYTVFGIYVALTSVLEMISDFRIRDIYFIILGIALIVVGFTKRKEFAEAIKWQKEIEIQEQIENKKRIAELESKLDEIKTTLYDNQTNFQ